MAKKVHKNSFDNTHFKKTEWKAKNIGKMYSEALQDVLKGFKKADIKPNKFFAFDDYPQYKGKMNNLFELFSKNITTEINKQSKESWNYAEKKNQDLLKGTMKKFGIKKLELRDKYSKSNLEALRAFQTRKDKGLGLSDKVWNQTKQFKKEIELALDTGLRDGKSAADLSRDVKKYLKEPDKLFRKVRDNHGNLKLSKAAKAYNPGQGVYRSSSKNAMRLTRTENNMAYHASNFEKYNDFDFVTGIEVILSNNSNRCPFCESMAGKYPKEFKFSGWHPHCRCTTIPILKTKAEMEADDDLIVQGLEPKESKNKVMTPPDNYQKYIEVNEAKLNLMPNKPYWYKDNSGLKVPELPIEKTKKIKTESEKALIQEKWTNRVNEHNSIRSNASGLIEEFKEWNVKFMDPDFQKPFETQKQLEEFLKKNKLSDLKDSHQFFKDQVSNLKVKVVEDWRKTLPQIDEYIGKFTPMEIDRVLDSTKQKVIYFNDVTGGDLAQLLKKYKFEVQWLEDKQNYNTWQIAQKVYSNKVFELESASLFKEADEAITFLTKELKKNPTKKGQDLINDIIEGQKNTNLYFDTYYLNQSLEGASDYINARMAKQKIKVQSKINPKSIGVDEGIQPAGTYTQKRRDDAVYTFDPEIIDNLLRDLTYERWKQMDLDAQKTLWAYTNSSGKINRPLRGYEGNWFNPKGLGKVSFNAEKADLPSNIKALDLEKGIRSMAKEIENHKLPVDLWARRGTDHSSFGGTFGITVSDLSAAKNAGTLDKFKGSKGVDNGFLSTSPAADSSRGFSGKIEYKIFAPKGTQAIYAEPFSYYGEHKNKIKPWDSWTGQKQNDFSSEFELIINQGYEYEILEIIPKGGDNYEVKIQVLDRKKRFKHY